MERAALPPANPRPRLAGLWLALLLSLVIHGCFCLALWFVAVSDARWDGDVPLTDVPIVIIPDGEWTLSLATEMPYRASRSATDAKGPEPDAEPITVRVEAQPIRSATTAPSDLEAPRVVGSPQVGAVHPTASLAGSGSETKNPTFFGVPTQARSIVYVIDHSISMGFNGALEAAKREVLASLASLPPTTRFQVLFYSRDVQALPTKDSDGMLANSAETLRIVGEVVKGVLAAGATDHGKALHRALSLRPQLIVVLTDGQDLTLEEVRMLTRLNDKRAIINTLEWGRLEGDDGPLAALANLNGGTHRNISSGKGELRASP